MNQILITEKVYVTPELRRKKKMYKFDFIVSAILVVVLFGYYLYTEYDKNQSEKVSKEILSALTFDDENVADDTTIKFSDNAIVVVLNTEEPIEEVSTEQLAAQAAQVSQETIERNTSISPSGQEYYTLAKISIPSIDVLYPVLSETTDELLKMAPTKFWGADPNEVGNFCIVAHNYRNTKFFSKVPTMSNGDIIEITDLTGRMLQYEVYDKYVVTPTNVQCTSQKTNGRKEVTLITCTNDGKNRVIVKAREVVS